jgi:hypothetical protein
MRKDYMFLLLMLFVPITFQAQTTLSNGNFEQWTGNKPTGWDASNFVFGTFQLQTVFKDTAGAIQGLSSARIETKNFNLIVAQPTIPGIVTLGTIVVNMTTFSGNVEGGIPFTGRPQSLKGFINAIPAAGDSAMIAIGFSKWDGTKRDTIGSGLAWYSTPHNEWVALDIPIHFQNSQVPDSLNIIISCSAIGNEVFVVGSKLWVDSLYFDYGNIMVEVPTGETTLSLWADQQRQLYYRLIQATPDPFTLKVFNMQGAMVHSVAGDPEGGQGSLDLSGLSPGVYAVWIVTADHRQLSRKIVLR